MLHPNFVIIYYFLCLQQALRNALRYFPSGHHQELANEFMEELNDFGHIYMYRFIPILEMRCPFEY